MTEAAVGAAPRALWVPVDAITGTDASPDQLAAAAAVASEVLWGLSGRRWPGLREDALRVAVPPGDVHLPFPSSFTMWTPGRTRGCPCHASHLDPQLPGAIVSVLSLMLGDTEVPIDQVRIEDRRIIRVAPAAVATVDPLAVNLWVDDEGYYALWPLGGACGRATEAELTVRWGTPPPEAGAAAAQQLATEIAKGLAGGPCRIAGNVTSVNRQGVSVLLDPATFLKEGKTGVPLVDLWLAAVNPNKLQRPSEVWWPEADAPVRGPDPVTPDPGYSGY